MILITSASYVNQELQNEFGRIPPAFLPLKNRRLYEHYNYNSKGEELFITLPKSYNLDFWDKINLERLGYQILYIDENLTLGESVAKAISLLPKTSQEVIIIHADALFIDIPQNNNCLIVSQVYENYNWGIETDSGLIYAGYFSIDEISTFSKILSESNYEFISAIELYKSRFSTPVISTDSWFDFGHLSTYYKSKSNFTTERRFNNIKISDGIVKKSGENFKIKSEVLWYKNLPSRLRIFTPKLIDYNIDEKNYIYDIQYKYLSSLNELFVFGELPIYTWKAIFNSCFSVIDIMSSIKINDKKSLLTFVTKKTENRIKDDYPFNLEKKIKYKGLSYLSVSDIISLINKDISNDEKLSEVMHGDFCFSNLLFDFRTFQIQMIDPRGMLDSDNFTLNGFKSYDLAKLTHSVLGLYDFILAERFKIVTDDKGYSEIVFNLSEKIVDIQSEFLSILDTKGYNFKSIMSICIHLFISMIPLHYDSPNRQQGFYFNIYRLYKEILVYDSITNGRRG